MADIAPTAAPAQSSPAGDKWLTDRLVYTALRLFDTAVSLARFAQSYCLILRFGPPPAHEPSHAAAVHGGAAAYNGQLPANLFIWMSLLRAA